MEVRELQPLDAALFFLGFGTLYVALYKLERRILPLWKRLQMSAV